jgi:hypothetical protein
MIDDNTYRVLLPLIKDFSFYLGMGLFLVSLIVGLVLIIKPDLIIRLNRRVGKKFSLRRLTKAIEVPNNIDRVFYRHHKIIGIVVTLVASYVLYYFTFVYDANAIAQMLKSHNHGQILDLLVSALRLFMLVSCVVIVLLGITIFFRPSQLKSIEVWANRWISTRQATRSLSVERNQVNQLVDKYPRLIGIMIVFLSVYACLLLYLVYTR